MRAEVTSEDTTTVFFSKREIISEPVITTTIIQSEGYYRAHQKMDSTPSFRMNLSLMTRKEETKRDSWDKTMWAQPFYKQETTTKTIGARFLHTCYKSHGKRQLLRKIANLWLAEKYIALRELLRFFIYLTGF